MKKISELSKEELLSLIYSNLPRTHFDDHPVQCAACGDQPFELMSHNGHVVMPMGYICDRCEEC